MSQMWTEILPRGEDRPGFFRLIVWEQDDNHSTNIVDIMECDLRFVLTRQMKVLDPDTKLVVCVDNRGRK